MTAIVGLAAAGGRVLIGADSAASDGQSVILRDDPKVFCAGSFVIGFTTSFRMGQILQHAMQPPEPKPGDSLYRFMVVEFVNVVRAALKEGGFAHVENGVERGGAFLVGVRGRLFQVQDDFQVCEASARFDACGSGEQIALGSLATSAELSVDPHERVKLALHAAAQFSAFVRPPFHIMEAM